MSTEGTPPPTPSLNELRSLLTEVIGQNRNQNSEIPDLMELGKLSRDCNHNFFLICALGALTLMLTGVCVAMYVRLDDKIDTKFDSVSAKIEETDNY